MLALLHRLWSDEQGQGMVEYGLIIALIAIAVIGVLRLMGTSLSEIFTRIQTELSGAAQ